MPTGKVKWYDADKGFGFLTTTEGDDVFVHAEVLPAGVTTLKPGTRVEFGIVQGRRGAQALQLEILDTPPIRGARKNPEDLVIIIEDLIKLLDGVSNTLRRGKHPEPAAARKVATVLRAVADDLSD